MTSLLIRQQVHKYNICPWLVNYSTPILHIFNIHRRRMQNDAERRPKRKNVQKKPLSP